MKLRPTAIFITVMTIRGIFCMPLSAAADTTRKTVKHGPWQAVMDKNVRLVCNGKTVAVISTYPPLADIRLTPGKSGMQMDAQQEDKTVHAEYTFADGRLRCSFRAQQGDKPARFTAMITFQGGDLAGTTVLLDNKPLTIPAKRGKHEFRHARKFEFFHNLPAKRLGMEFTSMGFANLRDFRDHGGRCDFQVFAVTNREGLLDFTLDFTRASNINRTSTYPGQEYLAMDDLHLPVLNLCRNLVQNPGFEGGFTLWGRGVTGVRRAYGREHGWQPDGSRGRTGKTSARYTVVKGFNADMLCTFPIAVKPGNKYTASFYARSDRPGAGFSAFVHTARWGEFPGRKRVRLTNEWRRYSLTFTAPSPFLRLCFGELWWENSARHKDQINGAHIWLDDVQLETGTEATMFTRKPIFCYSETGHADNVFFTDEPTRAVTVTMVNTSEQPRSCRLRVLLTGLDRAKIQERNLAESLPPWGRARLVMDLSQVKQRGFLRISMTADSGDFTETFFGRTCLLARRADPGRVVYAYHMEPDDMDPRFPKLQTRLQRLQAYGVWGSLAFHPPSVPEFCARLKKMCWTHVFTVASGRKCPVKLYQQKMTEADWRTLDQWLRGRIAPYRGQMLWKTVNEPNAGHCQWSPQECARTVAMIRRHVKALNPEAKILTPDPYNSSRNGRSWLEDFFKAGGNKLVDVVAIHTYRPRPEAPDLDYDIQELVKLKRRYGLEQAPIMFTEGPGQAPCIIPGIGMSPVSGFFEWRLGLLGLDAGRAEITAAAMMTRMLLACFKNNREVRYYLTWRRDISQGQPMVSLAAINNLYSLLGNADFRTEHVIGEQTKTYVFTTPEQVPVAVMWNHDLKVDRGEQSPPEAVIPLPGKEWRLLDMMGNPAPVRSSARGADFEVGSTPCYIVGRGLSLQQMNQALEHASIGGHGVRSVNLHIRLCGRARARLLVRNRLLRPLIGKVEIAVKGMPKISAAIRLDNRQGTEVRFGLPAAGPAFNPTDISAVFTEDGNPAGVSKKDELRWFTISRLRRKIIIDGDPSDWQGVARLSLADRDAVKSYAGNKPPEQVWHGPDDLSAAYHCGWDANGLYLCIIVRDDTFSQQHPIATAWKGDSLQLYIDLMADGHDRPGLGYDANDESIYVAKVKAGDLLWRDYTPMNEVAFVRHGLIRDGECAITRRNGVTVYELRLPPKQIFPLKLTPGTTFGFGILVNDADADNRRNKGLTNTPPGTEPHGKPELWPAALLVE